MMQPAHGFKIVVAALAAVLAVASPQVCLPTGAHAKAKTSKAISLTEARKALSEGKAAVEAGKYPDAVAVLTVAIVSKRLGRKELARALYYRGLAHRGRGHIANAVSDLTAALWMKNGLSKGERAKALAARSQAYQSAGLSNQGQDASAAPPIKRSAPKAKTATAARGTPSQGWSTKAAAPTPSNTSNPVASIQNFFGNLFNGSSQQTSAQNSPPTTGSVRRPESQPRQVSSWQSQPAKRQPKRAEKKPSGKYRIQVAAMRGKSEAVRLAATLAQRHGKSLPTGRADVTTKSIGNMGRFYLVEIGPFASPNATKPLCAQLKRDGLDCYVTK